MGLTEEEGDNFGDRAVEMFLSRNYGGVEELYLRLRGPADGILGRLALLPNEARNSDERFQRILAIANFYRSVQDEELKRRIKEVTTSTLFLPGFRDLIEDSTQEDYLAFCRENGIPENDPKSFVGYLDSISHGFFEEADREWPE